MKTLGFHQSKNIFPLDTSMALPRGSSFINTLSPIYKILKNAKTISEIPDLIVNAQKFGSVNKDINAVRTTINKVQEDSDYKAFVLTITRLSSKYARKYSKHVDSKKMKSLLIGIEIMSAKTQIALYEGVKIKSKNPYDILDFMVKYMRQNFTTEDLKSLQEIFSVISNAIEIKEGVTDMSEYLKLKNDFGIKVKTEIEIIKVKKNIIKRKIKELKNTQENENTESILLKG